MLSRSLHSFSHLLQCEYKFSYFFWPMLTLETFKTRSSTLFHVNQHYACIIFIICWICGSISAISFISAGLKYLWFPWFLCDQNSCSFSCISQQIFVTLHHQTRLTNKTNYQWPIIHAQWEERNLPPATSPTFNHKPPGRNSVVYSPQIRRLRHSPPCTDAPSYLPRSPRSTTF